MNGRSHARGQRVRRGIAAMIAASCLAASGLASAQQAPPAPSAAELAAARQLFGDALSAADEGRTREALEAFLRVEKIITSPQVHYQIALCHERLGELVEALNQFEMAIHEAEAKRAGDVLKESRAHADAIRQKVARLVLRAPSDAVGLVITIDGRPLNAALVGTPMPVNPGERRVAVRADNYAGVFEATEKLAAGEARTIEVRLGEKRRAASAAPAPAPAPVVIVAAPAPAPRRSYVPAIVAGSATLALTVGAVATGVAAHADYSQYIRENVTPPMSPRADREALRSAGIGKAWASTALTLGALAGAGVTIYFIVRAPIEAGSPKALALTPWAEREAAGLTLRGAL